MSPFRVSCSCGAAVTGTRRPRHQVATCPGCRQPLFVLPASPWQEEAAPERLLPPFRSAGGLVRHYRWRLIGGGVALIILGIVFTFLILPRWLRSQDGAQTQGAKTEDLLAALAKGQKLLSDGHFRLAQEQLEAVPSSHVPHSARQAWGQTLRQAADRKSVV